MTFAGTNFDTLTGRDPAGRPASWLVRVLEPEPAGDSALVTHRVKTHDGTTLLRRSLPLTGNPLDASIAEMLLDNEIRALVRLHARYPRPVPELPRIVGYDFDSSTPFVLLEPHVGKCLDGSPRTLLIDERRRFMVGVFRALAHLAAVDLVHGSVGLASLCWDGATAQLVNLEHAVNPGEPTRSGLSRNGSVAHTGDDVRAAGRMVYELVTGKRVELGAVPDLTAQPEQLATLLRGVFAARPADRPTALEVLERLNDRDPLLPPTDTTALMRAGYDRFDTLRPVKATGPRQQQPPPSPPVRRFAPRPERKPVPLLPLALLVFLAVAVVVALVVTR
ncbi:hypothetical protein AB0A63_17745 [Lentzea sp. NPDC042327]|uniref:hypothetical protein n=1 Tax=Lentzea sp. NPDC042327 TaxID=3154801 RepID=UPI00340CFA07